MARRRTAKGSEKNRKTKLNALLKQYKRKCYYCNAQVERPPVGYYQPWPAMATVDHLYDRDDIRRHLDGGYTKVLACWKCNQDQRTFLSFAPFLRKPKKFDIRDLLNGNHKRFYKILNDHPVMNC
jgi:hypothetical protein